MPRRNRGAAKRRRRPKPSSLVAARSRTTGGRAGPRGRSSSTSARFDSAGSSASRGERKLPRDTRTPKRSRSPSQRTERRVERHGRPRRGDHRDDAGEPRPVAEPVGEELALAHERNEREIRPPMESRLHEPHPCTMRPRHGAALGRPAGDRAPLPHRGSARSGRHGRRVPGLRRGRSPTRRAQAHALRAGRRPGPRAPAVPPRVPHAGEPSTPSHRHRLRLRRRRRRGLLHDGVAGREGLQGSGAGRASRGMSPLARRRRRAGDAPRARPRAPRSGREERAAALERSRQAHGFRHPRELRRDRRSGWNARVRGARDAPGHAHRRPHRPLRAGGPRVRLAHGPDAVRGEELRRRGPRVATRAACAAVGPREGRSARAR